MKPSIPQGTRDFLPVEVRKRQYIFKTIQSVFESYGFQPIETPAVEKLTTLMGKYGEEGDRLIFKILNNGLYEKKQADKEKLNEEWAKMLQSAYSTPVVTERALRYDLTIPFARMVVMHQNDLAFPFKRYQMQPVWRADRPQRGRYREFWQCDADVVGSTSLINEAELMGIYQEVFQQLQIPVQIKINSRKILAGIAAACGAATMMTAITVALDKIDKIGWEGVKKDLEQLTLTDTQIETVEAFLSISGSNKEKMESLKNIFQEKNCAIGLEGVKEIEQALQYHQELTDHTDNISVDISLARGLNYYTGIIVEVTTDAVKMGSIGGGGRYDDLTGLFGLKNLSGVGISFGVDRIYDVMEEMHIFPEALQSGTRVLMINFGEVSEIYALGILKALRKEGIAAEIYPDAVKFDKQMKYANKRNIPFVVIAGEDEIQQQKMSIKNFTTGTQQLVSLEEAIQLLKD